MAIVYRHRNPINLEVFYVGIGLRKKRAFELKHNRSKWHNSYVGKYGCIVEIVAEDIDYEDAKDLEIALIDFYGRKDLGLGNLINMTNGGDGVVNKVVSKNTKEKIRNSKIGVKRTNFDQTGSKNPMYGRGDLIAGVKNGMYGMSGSKNPFFGCGHSEDFKLRMKKSYGFKLIFEGVEYSSIRDAHRITGISRFLIKKNCEFLNKK